MSVNDIQPLSIMELFSEQNVFYMIPMYQRNFAWGEGEITQLIQDAIDYLPTKNNYYIGTLVVADRGESNGKDTVYETIDGQQRLTTLSLLVSYLKRCFRNSNNDNLSWYKQPIRFENRDHSTRTIEEIFRNVLGNDPAENLPENEINTAILNGYRLIAKILPGKIKENNTGVPDFADYLFSKVQIVRVLVPKGTDLNHYFEIMNSRGEQLEKHEILKAWLLEALNEKSDDQNCLHMVWEACANMERYVQMEFFPSLRDKIFGEENWSSFKVQDFCQLKMILSGANQDGGVGVKLSNIIKVSPGLPEKLNKDKETEAAERFNSVINFQNFLLNVLRVVSGLDVSLDDKRLLDAFKKYLLDEKLPSGHRLNEQNVASRVRQFTFELLRCRYLFDQYVIKREFVGGKDSWSLKRFKWIQGEKKRETGRGSYENTFGEDTNGECLNRRILMLLSVFHVSAPSMCYKYWLSAALNYLQYTHKKDRPIVCDAYLKHLESVAKAFVFDHFLATDKSKKGYDEIIKLKKNTGKCQSRRNDVSGNNLVLMSSFDKIENFVFNYLDYLLWVKYKNSDDIISKYDFSFRSSVEHYYPQHPMHGEAKLSLLLLHCFGNLCLISHSKNSRLSNLSPEAKKDFYKNSKPDSIKQHLMMKYVTWDKRSVMRHYIEMKKVLLKDL